MFKLTASLTTKNGNVFLTEQFFTDGEKDFAVTTAAKLEATPGFTGVQLLETVLGRGKLVTFTGGASKTNIKTVVRFSWIKFGTPPVKPVKPRKSVAKATVSEFDLPPAPKKRLSKRQREFGIDAAHRTAGEVVNA